MDRPVTVVGPSEYRTQHKSTGNHHSRGIEVSQRNPSVMRIQFVTAILRLQMSCLHNTSDDGILMLTLCEFSSLHNIIKTFQYFARLFHTHTTASIKSPLTADCWSHYLLIFLFRFVANSLSQCTMSQSYTTWPSLSLINTAFMIFPTGNYHNSKRCRTIFESQNTYFY